ncbi:hypothetical protein MTO96_049336 [Rhipicephalus appendiculatus]
MVAQMSARNGDGSDERVSLSCHTEGCSRFEALLADTLNTSVDPCHDFKAYVSSRWLPDSSKELDGHWRYEWDVKYAWMRMMVDEIRQRYHASPLERLMADSFEACAHRAKENAAETRKKFKQLMRELSIPWPEKPPSDVDPFEAHLNLSIRWNIPLWFDVKMLPAATKSGRKVIYIYPSTYAKFWRGQYLVMTSQASTLRYLDQYLAYFHAESTSNASGEAAADLCQYGAVFTFTRLVVLRLADVVAKDKSVRVLGFDSLARAFGLKTERLVSLMSEYFLPQNFSSFEPEDMAIVKATGTLDVVRQIITETDASTVLCHLGWWMLQVYAPIADNRFFVQKYGSEEEAELLRPLFCETQVETSFKILLLVNHMALNFRSSQRRDIHELLTSVREAAVAEYEKSDLPAHVKTLLTTKLKRLSVNLWPKPTFRSSALLRRIYSFKYASKKTDAGLLDLREAGQRGAHRRQRVLRGQAAAARQLQGPVLLRQHLGHHQLVDGRGARAVLLPRRRGVWGDQLRRSGRRLRKGPSWKASKTTPSCVTPWLVTRRAAMSTETRPGPGVLRPAAILLARSGLSSVWPAQPFCRHFAHSRRRCVATALLTRADSRRRKRSSSTSATVRHACRPASTATQLCEERPILFPRFVADAAAI